MSFHHIQTRRWEVSFLFLFSFLFTESREIHKHNVWTKLRIIEQYNR
jgi:hypothetical protein